MKKINGMHLWFFVLIMKEFWLECESVKNNRPVMLKWIFSGVVELGFWYKYSVSMLIYKVGAGVESIVSIINLFSGLCLLKLFFIRSVLNFILCHDNKDIDHTHIVKIATP